MAVDMIARMMAMGNGGGSGDSYTKAETDQLLDGKADLVDGKIPAAQLPSYVDDVLEYASTSAFPETGESGKIYISTDTNKSYRWTGTVYVRIDECPAFGETQGTIYEGNNGKQNADAIAAIKDGTNIDSFADVETALTSKADKSTTYTKTEVDTALATKLNTSDVDTALSSTSTNPVQNKAIKLALDGKQSTLTTEQLNAVNSGITASIVNKTSALINGLYMVASVAGVNGNQSLEYTVKRSDFNTMSGSGVDYTGTYLIHCIEWALEGKPYIGLITFSGGQYSKLTKTDVVTGFAPTITIDGGKFTISEAARISVYALR